MKKDGWVYFYQSFLKKKTPEKHPKYEVSDFTNNFMTPLLDKLSNENKDIMIYLEHE